MDRLHRVGERAPDFQAMAFHEGKSSDIRLSLFRGKWVILLFYIGDFTIVWPTELAAVAVKYPAFEELGAEVLVVSTDTINSHSEWQEKVLSRMVPGGARFPLISDSSGTIGSLYGVYDSESKREMRSHFIIDPAGIIQSVEMIASSVGRNVSEILRQLRALIHNRSTGEMMPCGWEPGKPALPDTNSPDAESGPWESWKPRNAF